MNAMELAGHAGVTYRQVDHWTRQGWIRSESGPGGSGHQREYSPAEVRAATWMARLTRAGFAPSAASRIVRGDKQLRMLALSALTDGWLEESA